MGRTSKTLFAAFFLVTLIMNEIRALPQFDDDSKNSSHDTVSEREKIVFPTENPLIPHFNPKCENSTYCEDVIGYPTKYVETFSQSNKNHLLSRIDMRKLIFPRAGMNNDGSWFYIVNDRNITQGITVEICKHENQKCNMISCLKSYETYCKQNYIYRELVVLSPNGQFEREMFRFPSSCSCNLK